METMHKCKMRRQVPRAKASDEKSKEGNDAARQQSDRTFLGLVRERDLEVDD